MQKEFQNETQPQNKPSNIKKVLFIQSVPCIRTIKIAQSLSERNIQVDLIYLIIHPEKVYKDIDLPFKNVYRLTSILEMINYVNSSDYDILYSSNEPDYLTVLFATTNKPIIHDTHDMMSLRAGLTNEGIILEYAANVMSTGNIYVNPFVKKIADANFKLRHKPVLCLHSFIEKKQLPDMFHEKLSKKDGEIHCVFEGRLQGIPGHHRYLEPVFLMLAQNRIHVHLHCLVEAGYIKQLADKSEYIHLEKVFSPKDLITEMTKYDVGLSIFNITERNKTFLDSAFPNKIWDYLAAGLPILFSDLTSFRVFAASSGVGKALDTNKDIRTQVEEVSKIHIDKDILINKKWLMNDSVQDIIQFMESVKESFNGSRRAVSTNEQELYDDIYSSGGYQETYFRHYSEAPYIRIWSKAASIIKNLDSARIIDIGCGPGQFANLLFDLGLTDYKGIDYSKKAIKMAKLRNDKYRDKFHHEDAYTSNIFEEEYNAVTLFEVLEHIFDDITILSKIRKGTLVIFSVPNYICEGHLRHFNSEDEIHKRYDDIIQINNIYEYKMNGKNIIYLASGIKI